MISCDDCDLAAIIDVKLDEEQHIYSCWYHGLDAMVFTDGKEHYCDLLDEVPWLEVPLEQ